MKSKFLFSVFLLGLFSLFLPEKTTAMFELTSKTTIGNYEYAGLVSAEVESGWDELTDKATIEFPRKLSWKGKNIATGDSPLIMVGDPVRCEAGYDGRNNVIFEGYVTRVHSNVPVKVECQDAMWLLKQKTFTKSYKEVNLKTLLADLVPTTVPFEAPDVRLGQFRLSNATPAQVLDELRKTYFLKSWTRAGKLYVGLAYVPALQKEYVLRFERNIISNTLEYQRKEDVRIKLKVVNIDLADNKKTDYQYGDPEGEQRTLYTYDKKAADIKYIAEQEIERLKYSGYKGTITTFSEPKIEHGDVVFLKDKFFPERDGRYLVRKVNTSFGTSAGRQTIELDAKIG